MKALEVNSLTKYYGPVRGVEDVTFVIEPGEIFGYLGPNGSGKTTTIRCIMGLLRCTSGGCRVRGERIVAGRGSQHESIGYLPGDFRIWPELTARRSLGMLAALGGDSNIAARSEELAEILKLDLDRPVGDLSKGNRQKVGIIYAFQHQPDILILDEPTSGLDPLIHQDVLHLIREAADAGAAVLLSSHDLNEVSAVCCRAGILRDGKLVKLAPVSEILEQGERRLKVTFAKNIPEPVLREGQLPGVRVIPSETGSLHFAYQGSPDAILKWIAQFPIDNISTPETSLEEAFIQYYNDHSRSHDKESNVRAREGELK